jgi:hypothetical protein
MPTFPVNVPFRFRFKRTADKKKVPEVQQLQIGELGFNITDQKLYTKSLNGEIIQITSIKTLSTKQWTELTGLEIGEFCVQINQ